MRQKHPSTKILPITKSMRSKAQDKKLGRDHQDLIHLLPSAVIVVSPDYTIRYANAAAEGLLSGSVSVLCGQDLAQFIYPATRLLELVDTAFLQKTLIKEYDVTFSGARMSSRSVNVQVLPIEEATQVMIIIDDREVAGKLGQHMHKRDSARVSSNMASILAHEVKNPLSGIRGAAQLLGQTVSTDDQSLTQLICTEVDRIRDVIEEMEIFSDSPHIRTEPLNIHEVLQYVRSIGEKGAAAHVRFKECYDPSLPEVRGNRNLLIQLFLNLVKNAAEALETSKDACITITTYYQSGMRFKKDAASKSEPLPIGIIIEDNGPGIAQELKDSLFEPFVTSKEGGKGLGLAIVAKIVSDHAGAIEWEEKSPQGTRFRILLPAA